MSKISFAEAKALSAFLDARFHAKILQGFYRFTEKRTVGPRRVA